MHALLLNDDLSDADRASRALSAQGHEVTLFHHLDGAIGFLAAHTPDVAIIDLTMDHPSRPYESFGAWGYPACCYALHQGVNRVIQHTSTRKYAHPGSIPYPGLPSGLVHLLEDDETDQSAWSLPDGGCPWRSLQLIEQATSDGDRQSAIQRLADLPWIRDVSPTLQQLQTAIDHLSAHSESDVAARVNDLRRLIFPGAQHDKPHA